MENKNIFPGWEIIGEIGKGAFSTVYKIRKVDEMGGEYFSALKVIAVPSSSDEHRQYKEDGYDDESISVLYKEQVSNIVSEFRLLSDFRGTANIVSYEDHTVVPQENGFGWKILIRMELLTALPKAYSEAPLTEADTLNLGIDICNALALCEKNAIIHRDIKPQNIFVNKFGDFKLGDFGIARTMDHTTRATKTGTPAYMAPEVHHGEAYNNTADIYSLGMVLYWLLNERRLPFLPLPPAIPTLSQNTEAQARRLGGEALPAPKHGSEELKQAVLKACAYNPKDRYKSAEEMGAALSAILNNTKKSATVVVPAELADDDDKTVFIPVQKDDEDDKTVSIFEQQNDDDKTTLLLQSDTTPAPALEPEEKERQNTDNGNSKDKDDSTHKNNEKADKKSKKGLLILLCLLLLLGIGAVIFGLVGDNDKSGNISDDNNQVITSSKTEESFAAEETTDETSYVNSESQDESSAEISEDSKEEISNVTPEIATITIESAPTKTSYYVGDVFDYSGLTLKITYTDGRTETVSDGFVCDAITFNTKGEQNITLSYGDKEAVVKVTVREVNVERISIIGYPNTYYTAGQNLDTAGLALAVMYSNGTEETITSGFTCSPTKFTSSGTTEVKVTYGGKEIKFEVTVSDVTVDSVVVKSKPTKTSYYFGDTLNTSGLSLTVNYNNGTSKTVTSGFNCTPTVLNKTGNVTVTASYGGKNSTFTIKVEEVKPTSISIKTKPTKTSYYVGDTLNTSGLTLTVNYNNGTSKTVTSGFSCSITMFTHDTAGEATRIIVTYSGLTTSFTVRVANVDISVWINTYQVESFVKMNGKTIAIYDPESNGALYPDNGELHIQYEVILNHQSVTNASAKQLGFYIEEDWHLYVISVNADGKTVSAVDDGKIPINGKNYNKYTIDTSSLLFNNTRNQYKITLTCYTNSLKTDRQTIDHHAYVEVLSAGDYVDNDSIPGNAIKNNTIDLSEDDADGSVIKIEICPNGLRYSVDDTATIVGHISGLSGTLYIPENVWGYKVSCIGKSAFEDNEGLTYVYVPKTVMVIEDSAFRNCSSLERIEMAEGVKTIGPMMCYNCANLKYVTLPSTLSLIKPTETTIGGTTHVLEGNFSLGLYLYSNQINPSIISFYEKG